MELNILLVVLLISGINAEKSSDLDKSYFASKPLTNENYKEVFESNEYVFVKFFTDW